MKKILSVLICLLLLAMLATPVFAAQSAKMTVTASKTELKPGDEVNFTVSVTKVENATIGGFRFTFDETVFEYKKGKRLEGLEDYMAGVTTAAGKVAGFFMNGKADIEGKLFSVTMKVRADAAPGTYTVTGKPSLTADDAQVDCTAVGAQVTVSAGTAAPDKVTPSVPSVPVPSVPAPSVSVPTVPITDQDPVENILPQEEQTPISGDTPESDAQKATLPQLQVLGEGTPQKPAFPWWIVAVIGVVAAGGAVFLILEIKKTKKTD